MNMPNSPAIPTTPPALTAVGQAAPPVDKELVVMVDVEVEPAVVVVDDVGLAWLDATTVAVSCIVEAVAEGVTNVMATEGPAVGLTIGMMYDLTSVGSAANHVGV